MIELIVDLAFAIHGRFGVGEYNTENSYLGEWDSLRLCGLTFNWRWDAADDSVAYWIRRS